MEQRRAHLARIVQRPAVTFAEFGDFDIEIMSAIECRDCDSPERFTVSLRTNGSFCEPFDVLAERCPFICELLDAGIPEILRCDHAVPSKPCGMPGGNQAIRQNGDATSSALSIFVRCTPCTRLHRL